MLLVARQHQPEWRRSNSVVKALRPLAAMVKASSLSSLLGTSSGLITPSSCRTGVGCIRELIACIPAIQDPQPHLAVVARPRSGWPAEGRLLEPGYFQQIDIGEQGGLRRPEG